jgi:tRNA-2-methylthio-N6-dimethylallyladenosine synthase
MADRFVPAEVAAERFERLRIVVERSALQKHQARLGVTEEVVVEGPSRKDPEVLTGRTRQNKLVHFRSDTPLAVGSFAEVRVTTAAPHHLTGTLVEVTARPRHRTRIPVVSA